MYCKNCGSQIDDDSKYCRYCGEAIPQKTPAPTIEPIEKYDHDAEDKRLRRNSIAVIIIVLILLAIVFGVVIKVTKDGDSIGTTSATNYDVSIRTDPSLFTYNIYVTPKKDISNLQITFEFYGDDNKKVATKTKTVGNVTKNKEYNISLSLSEFSLSSLSKISKFKWEVTGGTISS